MDARTGDRLTIHSHKVGVAPRSGTVVECLGGSAAPHYRVRWDDGRETVLSPGSDAVLGPGTGDTGPGPAASRFVTSVELRFDEDDDHTEARATLETAIGTFRGRGTARRNPVDANVPLVGEELAAARALMDLAGALREAAGHPPAPEEAADAHLTSA